MELWPVQTRFISLTLDAVARGVQRFLITSPTGSGKSISVARTVIKLVEQGYWTILFTNRRWLIDQLRDTLDKAGIDYGVRAAGHDNEDGQMWPVQISSLPTERERVLKRKTWNIFGHGRKKVVCFVDEAHIQAGPTDRDLYKLHTDAGHQIVGVTATPLDLHEVYDELGVAGTVSDCIRCGALVPSVHYGPDEPDFKAIKGGPPEGADFTSGQLKKLMSQPGLYGRIWDNFGRINPSHKPTLLFADSVEKSLWFAEQFTRQGVPAAHIDGDDIWFDGDFEKSETGSRNWLLAASRDGTVKVICNRYVAREGIDMPWIRHVIAATVFGSLGTFIQSLGRGLRADPYPDTNALWGPKEFVTVQDHGGNWWRHGSVMEDRDWHLDDTNERSAGKRSSAMRRDPAKEPFSCPNCRRVWRKGTTCSVALGGCGYELPAREKRSRPVVTADGTLKLQAGTIWKRKRTYGSGGRENSERGRKAWEKVYWRARNPAWNGTFRQAFATFARENNWGWPDPFWPLMPVDENDEYRLVKDVPMGHLRQASDPGPFFGVPT